MAKRTKRKRAAKGRSRSTTTRSRSKASGRKAAARSGGKAKRKSSGGSARRRGASGAAPRRRRAEVAGISERANQILEIPTDPVRFDQDEPPDVAEQARHVADSMVGDEEPGGTVMVPDHDTVDEYAAALGVERSPDSPVRSSAEILDERDERRRPGGPTPEEQRRTI
jgi:hypothetical protein